MNTSFPQCTKEEKMTWKVAQKVARLGLHIHSIAGSGFEFTDFNLVTRYET